MDKSKHRYNFYNDIYKNQLSNNYSGSIPKEDPPKINISNVINPGSGPKSPTTGYGAPPAPPPRNNNRVFKVLPNNNLNNNHYNPNKQVESSSLSLKNSRPVLPPRSERNGAKINYNEIKQEPSPLPAIKVPNQLETPFPLMAMPSPTDFIKPKPLISPNSTYPASSGFIPMPMPMPMPEIPNISNFPPFPVNEKFKESDLNATNKTENLPNKPDDQSLSEDNEPVQPVAIQKKDTLPKPDLKASEPSDNKVKPIVPKRANTSEKERYKFSLFGKQPIAQDNDKSNYINVMNTKNEPHLLKKSNSEPFKESRIKTSDLNSEPPKIKDQTGIFEYFNDKYNDISKLSQRALFIHIYIEREIKFFNNLNSVYKIISTGIKESDVFDKETSKEALETILFNIPDILYFYEAFLKTLIERYSLEHKKKKNISYGDIFLKFIDEFICFVEHARHFNESESYIKTSQKNSAKFKEWLQNLEKQCFNNDMSLISYLENIQFHLDPHISQLNSIFQVTKSSNNDIYVLDMVIESFQSIVKDITAIRESSGNTKAEPVDKRISYLPGHVAHLSQTLFLDMKLEKDIDITGYIDFDGPDFRSTIPTDLTENLSEEEFKRQEAIYELCRTERDYLRDLITIRKVYIEGLKKSSCYPSSQVNHIIHKLFFNYNDIKALHEPLCLELSSRQKNTPVVQSVGDLLIQWADKLEAYGLYGARSQFATDFCSKEKVENPKFQQFLDECSAAKEVKKLDIGSFISLPTRRLARYPLLLKEILKRTPETNPDFKLIPQTLEQLNKQLSYINQAKGETDTKLRLRAINDRLEDPEFYLEEPFVNLALDDDNRKLHMEGELKLVKGSAIVKVFLFDHYILFTKEHELCENLYEYEVYRKPVPLGKLSISGTISDNMLQLTLANLPANIFNVFSGGSNNLIEAKTCFSIYVHDTKETIYFAASSIMDKNKWVEKLEYANSLME